jgi:hypothetical protein
LHSKKIEGYYIKKNNEKVTTFFNVPVNLSEEINFQAMTFSIKYFDENDKKQKLDLSNVKELGFEYLGKKVVLKCFLNTAELGGLDFGDKKYVLLKPIREDVIGVYYFSTEMTTPGFMTGPGGHMMGSTYHFEAEVLVKFDGQMVQPGIGLFKRKMKDFFSDCPELVKKIDDKVYKRQHIKEMILFYKQKCVASEVEKEK